MKQCNIVPFPSRKTALEFFSGIGLARAGMQKVGVQTIWANDVDETKCALYEAQWGSSDLVCKNVFDVDPGAVPTADIAWASSPAPISRWRESETVWSKVGSRMRSSVSPTSLQAWAIESLGLLSWRMYAAWRRHTMAWIFA